MFYKIKNPKQNTYTPENIFKITKSEWEELRNKDEETWKNCQQYLLWVKQQDLGEFEHIFNVSTRLKQVFYTFYNFFVLFFYFCELLHLFLNFFKLF